MSSVGSGTIHSDHTVAQITPDEKQEENDLIGSENRHPSADNTPLHELLSDEEVLRQFLQEEEEDCDRDRNVVT